MGNGSSKEMLKLIIQAMLSTLALGSGFYLIWVLPELREWGTGMVGFVMGYWLT